MKKALAVILSIIMLLSLLVSCDDEQNSSSSEGGFEKLLAYPYVDDEGFPVFRNATDIYEYINVQAREELAYEPLDTIPIVSYEEMHTFMLQNLNQSSVEGINEAFFSENILMAVYRDNNRKTKEHYSYANVNAHKTINHHYYVELEYVLYPDKGYTMEIAPNTFDLVKIPKSLISSQNNLDKLVFEIIECKHKYSCHISLSDNTIMDYDKTINAPNVEMLQGREIVMSSVKNKYEAYTHITNVEYENYDDFYTDITATRVITEYDSFLTVLTKYTGTQEHEKITKDTFDNYFVVVANQVSPYRHYESYGDLKKNGDYYVLDFEYMSYDGRSYTDDEKPITIDFVLIPRVECNSPEKATIHFRKICHLYGYSNEYYFMPF